MRNFSIDVELVPLHRSRFCRPGRNFSNRFPDGNRRGHQVSSKQPCNAFAIEGSGRRPIRAWGEKQGHIDRSCVGLTTIHAISTWTSRPCVPSASRLAASRVVTLRFHPDRLDKLTDCPDARTVEGQLISERPLGNNVPRRSARSAISPRKVRFLNICAVAYGLAIFVASIRTGKPRGDAAPNVVRKKSGSEKRSELRNGLSTSDGNQ